ncbi:MAG: TetR/AcrR family transcriptional regulator [Pleurocapsa minor GSE-CHR-MK-17-07R]|jgi:AcrR family transcriptional regulator|nr:TetR/AcrR family transcriptional regulator [Pleurocapsa minor GSE-CHR-MK 17-07R]
MRHQPRQERARQRVDAILQAAEYLLLRADTSDLNTNMIAELAQVPVGSVYQYFSDKDQVVIALLERFRDDIVRHYQQQGTMPLVDALVTPMFTYGGQHFGTSRVLMTPPANPVVLEAVQRVRGDIQQEWAALIRLHLPRLPEDQVLLAADISLTAASSLIVHGSRAKQTASSEAEMALAESTATRIIKQVYPLLNGYFAQISAQHQSSPE